MGNRRYSVALRTLRGVPSLVIVASFLYLVVLIQTSNDNVPAPGVVQAFLIPNKPIIAKRRNHCAKKKHLNSSSLLNLSPAKVSNIDSRALQSSSSSLPSKIIQRLQTPFYMAKFMTSVAIGVSLLRFSSLSSSRSVITASISKFINRFFTQYPYVAAFAVCAFKASSADLIVQKSSKSTLSSTFEYKRNFAFFFYGGAYQGCIQEYIFNHFYPLLFGYSTLPSTVCKIVSFDMLVTSPLLCLPVAYVIKGAIYEQNIIKSMQGYIHDVMENKLLLKYWLSKFRTNAHILHIIQSDYYFGVQII